MNKSETHRKYYLTDGKETLEMDWMSEEQADRKNRNVNPDTPGSLWWEPAPEDDFLKNPGDPLTFEEYCGLEYRPDTGKAEAYIAGGLRGGWEWNGWFYTIIGKSIICEPVARLNRVRLYD